MMLRMREKRNILYLLLVFVVFSLLLYANKDALPAGFSISDLAIGISAAQLPKITVIAIWTISKPQPPAFFPFFFHSVESNPEVDLLFVQIDKLGHGCPKNSDAPNVIEVCLTEDEYYELHADFLCKKWQCTSIEKRELKAEMRRNSFKDKNNSFFRILRNGIFERFLPQGTTIWGWCDIDIFWGNFARTFPWDIANDFDIFVPASMPEFVEKRLIYTRGHMAFFRHSPQVLAKMHEYPKFRSLRNYYELPETVVDAEESSFSHYMFSEETSFTFLTFDALVQTSDPQLMSYGRQGGVFYTFLQGADRLTPERRGWLAELVWADRAVSVEATFSDEGWETEAIVHTDGSQYSESLWFDRQWATFVETRWFAAKEREQRAFIMRREAHGPITQRLEPRSRFLHVKGDVVVDESLYKHWKDDKREADWFYHLVDGLRPNEILVQLNGFATAEIWNEKGETIRELEPRE